MKVKVISYEAFLCEKIVNEALHEVFDGHCPSIVRVMSGLDMESAAIVASDTLSAKEAQEIWDENSFWDAFRDGKVMTCRRRRRKDGQVALILQPAAPTAPA